MNQTIKSVRLESPCAILVSRLIPVVHAALSRAHRQDGWPRDGPATVKEVRGQSEVHASKGTQRSVFAAVRNMVAGAHSPNDHLVFVTRRLLFWQGSGDDVKSWEWGRLWEQLFVFTDARLRFR